MTTLDAFRFTDLDGDFRRDPKTDRFCVRCQKDMKLGQSARVVHLVGGGHLVLHPSDEDAYTAAMKAEPNGELARSDLGCFPIGMDCARKLGMEWTHPA